jgi:hypothetical protein
LTARLYISLVLPTHPNSKREYKKDNVPAQNSRFSTLPICIMHIIDTEWTRLLRVKWMTKLTALFTARRGHGFLAYLSGQEGLNYQFDFLQPTHSLFGYVNRLVEQYTKVIQPNQQILEQLKERTQEGAWRMILQNARKHGEEQVRERAEMTG